MTHLIYSPLIDVLMTPAISLPLVLSLSLSIMRFGAKW